MTFSCAAEAVPADNKITAGTISANGSGFDVTGLHTYAARGSYSITVTITDVGGAQATAASTALVNALTVTLEFWSATGWS